ncbi:MULTISPECIES: DUF3823 domain-containing protein [Sphingobacterium]|jgi:hypothetical protein|uniref:DUF3823 domain-containing protein n=1 Tax=Sphingobacterium TaxID=28453 RepID=UPI00104B8F21|nr:MULTISPECIES: DUF3823 domain-containing protein [Sphingobacterium]MCW2263841.1 hypothetical protein [Sphingobacterium kitahiroshimense]NJI73420.1 DUF3823 domain-containing protein [Sphingobacterium sp. B16(2022)]TCR00361.1 uncharacterized protein DUF3823 [Sphingobacterium sp. JUb78]
MKKNILTLLTATLGFLAVGCEYDNFEAPKEFLSGKVVFEGKAVGVRNNGTELELWQDGYPLKSAIPVFINQAGEFSANLFRGKYKLVRKGNAPWLQQSTDTILVNVNGNTVLDVPVTPYFVIGNESFQVANNQIAATFTVKKTTESAKLDQVKLFLSKSILTDHVLSDQDINVDLPQVLFGTETRITRQLSDKFKGQAYIFVRIGVKSSSAGEYIYTPVQKIMLN